MSMKSVEDLIELLENVKQRPNIWLPNDSPDTIRVFLFALEMGVGFSDIPVELYDEHHKTRIVKRGWNPEGSLWLGRQMQQQGYDNSAICDELLTIAIEAWRRVLKDMQSTTNDSDENR